MDCLEPYVKFAKPVIKFGWKLGVQHLVYILHYRQKVEGLNGCVTDIRRAKERVNHQRDEAEKNLHNVEGAVIEWFRKVDEFETKVAEFGNDEGHGKTQFPWNRYRLAKQAEEMAEDVKKLINESPKFDEVAYRENVTSNDATLSNAGFVEFGSTKSTMEDIMAQLEDSTVRMIGLYGPGGVGKSTLIKEVAKKARDEKLFNVVVKVEITANPNLQKIQDEIAYVLGLRLEGGSENVRADCLRRRLKKEKENTLVILDDLWDKLDFNKLGIPLDDDKDAPMNVAGIPDEIPHSKREKDEKGDKNDAEKSKDKNDKKNLNHVVVKKEKLLGDYLGCKILLTSRYKKVLSDHIRNDDSIFTVRRLDDKDALMLFQKVAGIPDEMSNSKQEIVKKYCARLPMAILTVARALRDKSDSVWEATLEKLKNQELVEVQNSMEISVKMSYDHLENEELKSIFLLCAQMGHQPLIIDLVKYCFGLGILEGVHLLGEAQERIRTSIQKLKDSTLMLDVSSNDHFNVHDMVRDAALSIAHKEKNVFTLRNGKLDDWPELDRCTSISICNSDIIDELPNVLNCPQLKYFQIDSDDPSLKIPDSFFEQMKKLRVLILSGIHLTSLPSLIKCLSNLRMLCLERCTLDGNLCIIGELKKLRILSFSGSQIENLPTELEFLNKLQSFDISNCSMVEMIQPNLISRLTSLEELYIRKSLMVKLAERETDQGQISFLSELRHLHQLKVVDLSIPYAAVFPNDLFFDKLNDYKIVIGDFKTFSVGDFRMPKKYEKSRSVALQLKDDNIHSHNGINLLLKKVENLLLGDLNGVENVIDGLNLDGFPFLKHLSITDNTHIKYIINSVDLSHPQEVFPNLESLCLHKLRNIEMICRSPVLDSSFPKLKSITVKMCAQLKNLFSIDFSESNSLTEIIEIPIICIANLEVIDISESNSLKEIVEIPVNCVKVKFLKLHSLTLQSLLSLTSFYTKAKGPYVPHLTEIQTTKSDLIVIPDVEDKAPLFGELVEIPNLESLNLSSMNILKIWSDKPLSSFCFKNLIKLIVKDCYKLRYLCSLTVASGLNKLKGLFISKCQMMEKLFSSEGNNADKVQVCVFPKLEEIHLSQMKMLTEIWQPEVNADSFSSLISVHVEMCEKLDKVFPRQMEGWFASLDSLKVVDCKSVEVLFEIEDSQQIDASGGIDTNLQHILLDKLPNLKQVWSTDPRGILNFKKLQGIEVSACNELCSVFPISVAKDVVKLEYMLVLSCKQLVEIVASEDGSEANNEPLVFPELTNMRLYKLPNIKHFYQRRHPILCPKLKLLTIVGCDKLKTFGTKTSENTNEVEKAVFSVEKIIPSLEEMQIEFVEVEKWLLGNSVKYQMHSLKELSLIAANNIEPLRQFLRRMPDLEKLELCDSGNSFKNFSLPYLGTVLQLKELTWRSSNIRDLGFEQNPVLQSLRLLSLNLCRKLIKLAPPSVSLTYLTYLEVKSCYGLQNLMASSTAKSLVQLKTMKVIDCDNIKEIVTNEGNAEDMEIVFCKLITIELVTLKGLTSFCSYKRCKFKFPSLEILIVRECPTMETFTEIPASAPKLQNILAVEGQEEANWQWEGDLNATLQKVFNDKVSFAYSEHLNLSNHSDILESLWHHKVLVQENKFRNLKRLSAYSCDKLKHVIPSHLLPCFENLEELHVWGCNAAKVIFNINDEVRERETKALGITRLKKLSLTGLPELEHVWDKDPEGIIGLRMLEYMCVERCNCLKSLFPASVAEDLARLEVLTVTECKELEEIFSKDEKAADGETKMFEFSCLTSLTLEELPKLKYFHPRLHTLELPVLQELRAFHCELVTPKCQENHPQEQALIQIDQKVVQIRSLKKLSFGVGDPNPKVTWDQESGQLQFHFVRRFHEVLDSTAPLYRFLDTLPTIESLEFAHCSFEELFSDERPNADYNRILMHLKGLQLGYMRELRSIGLEHSWLQPFPQNLQTLEVKFCYKLEKLIPRTVSFSNLTYLEVSACKKLLYLFATSTAKSLAQLKRMEIKGCDSITRIVSKEKNDSREGEPIIFGQLQVLYLDKLYKLKCFYPGNCTLRFPCLEKVYVIGCHWMDTFSPANKIDHSTNWFSAKHATPQKERDLNSAAHRSFEEKIWESARSVSHLRLAVNPRLQKIWHSRDSMPIPDLCFSKLHSMTVVGCKISEVLPFKLLPFLTKLEILEVRNCDSVKTIFDVKTEDRIIMTTPGPASFTLKKLTLWGLPKLENIWNEDPHGILSMQLLEKVQVQNCKSLTSVFPASVANIVKLETLVVQDCEDLMTIAAEDNAYPGGTNLELTFPCPFVKSWKIQGLPKLKYFYYCSLHCDMSNTCTRLEEPHTEDQVCIKKCLALGENGLKMIWCGEFQKNLLHELKVVNLLNFDVESDVFPYEILQEVPNVEILAVCGGSFMEISRLQNPEVLSQQKLLRLESLPKLVSIGLENPRIEPFLRKIQTLQVISCFGSINLVTGRVSFSNLTCLEVEGCNSMIYLFTSSTAKSMAQLKKMEIRKCDSIEQIVSKEGDESDEDEIIFEQLSCLELRTLPKLGRFYKGSLSFPSLDQLSVIGCERMVALCPGTLKADKLVGVKLDESSEAIPLETDLKSFMQKPFLERISKTARMISNLELRDRPLLQEIWHGSVPIPDLCFSKLGSLIVDGCQFLSYVLPFNLLPFFTKLKTLNVRNSDSVKTIFDVKCTTQDREMATMRPAIFPLTFALKNLTLSKLPNLGNIWNEDPHGILCMQLLQEVFVDNCKCLTRVFPALVAKDLVKLEKLVVQDCKELMAIVAEDNVDLGGTNLDVTLPYMTSMMLCDLPKFKYNGAKTFKLTPNLEHLTVGENELKMILRGEFQGNHLHKLKVLTARLFRTESHAFLQQVPNTEELVVSDSFFKEIFRLPELKLLRLESLGELFSIGLENTWIEPFLRNQETLRVISHFSSINLVPCTVTFSRLTLLEVQLCKSLLYLFTASTAKSLAQLKRMNIRKCGSIEEIVSREGHESQEDEIIFPQLNCLNLEDLPELKSFYGGSLSFPLLEELSVIYCDMMETICPGSLKADKLVKVKLDRNSGAIPLEMDLKSTMQRRAKTPLLQ